MYLFTSDFAEPEIIKFVWLCKISYSSRFVKAFSTQTKYKSLLADIVLNNKGRITSQPCNILRGSGAISLLACTSHRNRCSLDRWQTYSNKNTRALSLVLYVTSKPLSLNRFAYLCFWMQYVTIFFLNLTESLIIFFLRMYSFLRKKYLTHSHYGGIVLMYLRFGYFYTPVQDGDIIMALKGHQKIIIIIFDITLF